MEYEEMKRLVEERIEELTQKKNELKEKLQKIRDKQKALRRNGEDPNSIGGYYK